MFRFALFLSLVSPILSISMCDVLCQGMNQNHQDLNNQFSNEFNQMSSNFQKMIQQPHYTMPVQQSQFQRQEMVEQPYYGMQVRQPQFQRQEMVETVQQPVIQTVQHQAPVEAMFAHHSQSASSSSMGYYKSPGVQTTQVQTQPMRMQTVRKQPCYSYDPCVY